MVYHTTLGSRLIKKKKGYQRAGDVAAEQERVDVVRVGAFSVDLPETVLLQTKSKRHRRPP